MWERVVGCVFFFEAEDGIRDYDVTGVQTCALPIFEESSFAKGNYGWGYPAPYCASSYIATENIPAHGSNLGNSRGIGEYNKPMDKILTITAVSGWALPRQWFAEEVATAFPGSQIEVIYPETPEKSEEAEKLLRQYPADRSEERRVGKECRSRWSPSH